MYEFITNLRIFDDYYVVSRPGNCSQTFADNFLDGWTWPRLWASRRARVQPSILFYVISLVAQLVESTLELPRRLQVQILPALFAGQSVHISATAVVSEKGFPWITSGSTDCPAIFSLMDRAGRRGCGTSLEGPQAGPPSPFALCFIFLNSRGVAQLG